MEDSRHKEWQLLMDSGCYRIYQDGEEKVVRLSRMGRKEAIGKRYALWEDGTGFLAFFDTREEAAAYQKQLEAERSARRSGDDVARFFCYTGPLLEIIRIDEDSGAARTDESQS